MYLRALLFMGCSYVHISATGTASRTAVQCIFVCTEHLLTLSCATVLGSAIKANCRSIFRRTEHERVEHGGNGEDRTYLFFLLLRLAWLARQAQDPTQKTASC